MALRLHSLPKALSVPKGQQRAAKSASRASLLPAASLLPGQPSPDFHPPSRSWVTAPQAPHGTMAVHFLGRVEETASVLATATWPGAELADNLGLSGSQHAATQSEPESALGCGPPGNPSSLDQSPEVMASGSPQEMAQLDQPTCSPCSGSEGARLTRHPSWGPPIPRGASAVGSRA